MLSDEALMTNLWGFICK